MNVNNSSVKAIETMHIIQSRDLIQALFQMSYNIAMSNDLNFCLLLFCNEHVDNIKLHYIV